MYKPFEGNFSSARNHSLYQHVLCSAHQVRTEDEYQGTTLRILTQNPYKLNELWENYIAQFIKLTERD